jgi:phage tail sheath protein FI
MAFSRPGVYVQETLNPIQPTVGPNSDSVAAFVGANDRGPTTPTLVTSWTQYVNLFGSWNSTFSNDLPIAVYLFFTNGGRQAYILRVVTTDNATAGNNAAVATKTLKDRAGTPVDTLVLSAKNPGIWGNALSYTITEAPTTGYFNLNIYYNAPATPTDAYIVEKFTDLSMVSTNARYALTVINTSSTYITATLPGTPSATTAPNNNPAVASTPVALASATDGIAPTATILTAALSLLDPIDSSLVLNLPNRTDATTINAALAYAYARGDVFVVIDPVAGAVVGPVATSGTQLYVAATYGTSTTGSYGAVYYPQIVISDPTVGLGAATGTTRSSAPGGAIIGLYAATDAARGVFKAPAGIESRIAGAVSVTPLSSADLDSLNSAAVPVNAIKYVPGSGIVVMGARTLKSGYVDRYIPVRRTLIYLRKSLKDLSDFAVFEPNDPTLWRQIDATLSSFLTDFWAQGGLNGATPAQAFYVKVDSTNNSQSSIDNGELTIEVGVSLQRPAEFVIIKIGQFNGSTTVTVA